MSQLLNPDRGRLVCLEWPLHKALSAGGPPWGLSAGAYAAHLSHPGVDLPDGENGPVVQSEPAASSPPSGSRALRQLARITPARTHKAGYDEAGNVVDRISVWSHAA